MVETYFLLSLQMLINALATGLNALNDSYRSLFANYYALAISAIITGAFVYILNKSIKDRQSVNPLYVGLAAFGFAIFMASLAALTKVEVVHYIHVNCFFACFFNYLRSCSAASFDSMFYCCVTVVVGFVINLATVVASMMIFEVSKRE